MRPTPEQLRQRSCSPSPARAIHSITPSVAQVTLRAAVALGVALSMALASRASAQSTTGAGKAGATVPSSAAADAAYDRVVRQWSTLRTLQANFEQKIVNSLIGRTATSHGTFLQQKPGRVNVTFTDPVGDRIVGDGTTLWVYLPSSAPGQVMKLPANAEGAVVADMLGQLLDTPRKTFTISGGEAATIDGRASRRVLLVPREKGSTAFQKATLWIDDAESRPLRVQIVDAQGIDRTITLTTWNPNVAIAKDAFTFKVPKGVKVLTKLPG